MRPINRKYHLTSLLAAWLFAPIIGYSSAPDAGAPAVFPRMEISLDGPGWHVWLDKKAEWEKDTLYAPGEVPPLKQLPVNPPTDGWDAPKNQGTPCKTPACAEQIFAKGDPRWFYHGVIWFSRTVDVPTKWQGKTIRLDIGRAHLRVEVYVNHKLAGYDLCCESPASFDLTPFLECGKANDLDIRVTNPGGTRGYDDVIQTRWGTKRLPAGRDFGGLDTLTLTATDPVHAQSVFIMNKPPANGRRIQIIPTIINPTGRPVDATLTAEILPVSGGAPLHTETWKAEVPTGANNAPSGIFAVPEAKLWDIESPNLYTCRLTIQGAGFNDQTVTRFGFRVFQVRPNSDGKSCFYLNGKRFRHRSAIDFGFYAHTGFFATDQEVERSIRAAKEIGHNGINLHRHIGESRMLDAADKLGLAMYEEPGGLHQWQGGDPIEPGTLADKVIQEKVRRMALRDRNHPSLLIHNLSNEDNFWGATREQAMNTIHALNPAVFVCNASGGGGPGYVGPVYEHAQPSGPVKHIRPYETEIRTDYQDDHTVGSTGRFHEFALRSHSKDPGNELFYYGEVFCHTGPANWWLMVEQEKESPAGSYDASSFKDEHDRIQKAFTDWNLSEVGSKLIRSPADVSRQAGRSLMYMDGRLGQRIMANNSVDGFAINGWSAHSYYAPEGGLWDSAIVDEGRNIKGPAEDYRWWVRPVQVALFRKNGKVFNPGDTAEFEAHLINEGGMLAGEYQLRLTVTDGVGNKTGFEKTVPVTVKGGDTYAEKFEDIAVPIMPEWHAGHITLCAELKDAKGKTIADGKEQVLLKNRPSFARDLSGLKIAVANWPAAQAALEEAKTTTVPVESADIVLAGDLGADAETLLELCKNGKTLVVRFDGEWANLLHERDILSAPVTEWGGEQSELSMGWFGNGWGYLDHFVGNQGVPSKTTLGANGWEVPGKPLGFFPFESPFRKAAYGLFMARSDDTAGVKPKCKNYEVPIEKLGNIPEAGLFRACGYSLAPLALKVPNGDYKVTLRFCEPLHSAPGMRVFNIQLQGQKVAENVDIVKKAGAPFMPVNLSFNTTVKGGVLSLVLETIKDEPCLSGIVIERVGSSDPWIRKVCFGQPAWQDYTSPKSNEWSIAPSFAVLLGTIDYGRGKIVLAPSYPVDDNHAFNDLLFFNLIGKAAKKDW
jgi:hypothetical protein